LKRQPVAALLKKVDVSDGERQVNPKAMVEANLSNSILSQGDIRLYPP
jgi:hypothetical protein